MSAGASTYQASYAYQTDGGTSGGTNPVNYHAHYALGDLSIGFQPIGAIGAGYELLGSDDGRAFFVTPLATFHKFNGWADVVDNPGVNGLQDAYAYVSPALPWKLTAQVIYHQFWSHEHGHDMGREIDAVLSRKFGAYLTVLAKAAWYEDGGRLLAERHDQVLARGHGGVLMAAAAPRRSASSTSCSTSSSS